MCKKFSTEAKARALEMVHNLIAPCATIFTDASVDGARNA